MDSNISNISNNSHNVETSTSTTNNQPKTRIRLVSRVLGTSRATQSPNINDNIDVDVESAATTNTNNEFATDDITISSINRATTSSDTGQNKRQKKNKSTVTKSKKGDKVTNKLSVEENDIDIGTSGTVINESSTSTSSKNKFDKKTSKNSKGKKNKKITGTKLNAKSSKVNEANDVKDKKAISEIKDDADNVVKNNVNNIDKPSKSLMLNKELNTTAKSSYSNKGKRPYNNIEEPSTTSEHQHKFTKISTSGKKYSDKSNTLIKAESTVNHTANAGKNTSSFVNDGESTVTINKQPFIRKLGRPPKIQKKIYNHSLNIQKKKKEIKVVLIKLLESINKKDTYGFFLEPVDTSVVTDYLDVIEKPMDFGTMRQKIEKNEYKTIDEFKTDLDLVIKNCKIYNAPNTIYYKSAERIWNFGEKAIERERDNILTEEDIKKAAEEDAQLNRLGGSSTQESKGFLTPSSSFKGVARNKRTSVSKRRNKRADGHKKFAIDGSLILTDEIKSMMFDSSRSFEIPQLKVISSSAQRTARFEDYGPYATLGVDPPYFTSREREYLYDMYGDERGYSYTKSIQNFVSDLGTEMRSTVDEYLNGLTRGTYKFGIVDIGKEVERARELPQIMKQKADLELWQREKIDINLLVNYHHGNNIGYSGNIDSDGDENKEIIASNSHMTAIGGETKHVPINEINYKSSTTPFNGTTTSLPMSKLVIGTTSATAKTIPTTPPPPSSIVTTTQSSGMEPTTISALSPISPLISGFGGSFGKGRAKPCNYNPAGRCANCQTTDTPGWRVGEMPEQKLCNACGLYYAKNRSHRPSNLWNNSR
ncbi:3364_t:CDS:10 [Entrophospora sp. SA101]|nr:3364_t:CDS:10 [Entrophospora sp. SA101]CAJ0877596.1 10778_t:CDS:10 [Entrophospora sp. SA101]